MMKLVSELGTVLLLLAIAFVSGSAAAAEAVDTPMSYTIKATVSADGRYVYFDPIGLWVPPGATVTWVVQHGVHTVTAYHPSNDNHALRIPEGAKPWDSGYLFAGKDDTFSYTFSVAGVYDYYCKPHEMAGMVGRIVVGDVDPASAPTTGIESGREPIPAAAQAAFPSVSEILTERVVHAPVSG